MSFHQERADALAEQIAALRAEATEITSRDAAEVTDEDVVAATAKIDEATALREKYEEHLRLAADVAALEGIVARGEVAIDAPVVRNAGFNINTRTDPFDLSDLRRGDAGYSDDLRSRAETVIESHLRSDVPDAAREGATFTANRMGTSKYDADAVNEHIIVSSTPDYVRAWQEHLRTGGRVTDPVLMRTAMSNTAANGGVLVPQFLDPTIVLTNAGSNNAIRQVSSHASITVDQWDGVTSAGVTAEWLAEGSEAADASPTFVAPTITAHKAAAYAFASYEMVMDSGFNEIGMLFADAKDRLEETAFTTGTGSGQPYGLITRLSGTGPVVAGAQGDAGAATLSTADPYALVNNLGARWRKNASWMANITVWNTVRQLGTSNNYHSFWTDLGAGLPPVLLGRPVYEDEAMDSTLVSGSNDYAILFGDFNAGYKIVDRVGFSIVNNPLVIGSNERPTGQQGWFGFWRVGADVITSNAFKLLKL